jgi:hypothetical protein
MTPSCPAIGSRLSLSDRAEAVVLLPARCGVLMTSAWRGPNSSVDEIVAIGDCGLPVAGEFDAPPEPCTHKQIQGRNVMSRRALLASSIFAGFFTTQISAAEIKYDNYACYAGANHVIQHADGYVSGSFDAVLMVQGPERDPLYLMSAHCVGTFTIIGGAQEENGSCQYVSAGGDKIFAVFARKGDPTKVEGTLRFVHGTGKFDGISGEGKYQDTGTYPPSGAANMGNGCNREWGTYTVK